MAFIPLNINVVKLDYTLAMQLHQSMRVSDVCQVINKRVQDHNLQKASKNGLFKPYKESTGGCWLDQERTLQHYDFESGDLLVYKEKTRPLRVRTLDDSVKTLLIDDSLTVAELTKVVCARIGLHNPEEFSFTTEEKPPGKIIQNCTGYKARNQKKLDSIKKKLHTDDELNWVDMDKPLCEQGIEESTVLTLRKKFFISDQNVHSSDPVQLNLLYAQLRDGIINGTHPCTRTESVHLAALQCQIQYGNHDRVKHKPGFLELRDFLPHHFLKVKGIEKKVFVEHCKLYNLSEINAKFRYVQLCRSLKTYGVTFFLVKEKVQKRKKLLPCLLGITRESVMRLDEKTKDVLSTWSFSSIRGWAATPNSISLDLGAYSKCTYSALTTEGEAITCLLSGYIDIITQKDHSKHEIQEQAVTLDNPSQCESSGYSKENATDQEAIVSLQIKQKAKQTQGNEYQHLDSESMPSTYSASSMPQPAPQRKVTDPGHYGATCRSQSQHETFTDICTGETIHKRHLEASSEIVTELQMKTANRGISVKAKTEAYMYENLTDLDRNDYMMLIKSQQVSEHDYQSLQFEDSPTDTDPDYDYTSSWEDTYQPLLLESIKPVKHSCDSTYQTLFSLPYPKP